MITRICAWIRNTGMIPVDSLRQPPRDVEGTAEIAVECLPNNGLMSMIFIPGLQLEPENVRALSVHSDNRRTQFSVRALRENNDAPILVDYDHLRAKPKRTRRFVETLWTGNGATLQLGKRSWRFDPSSSCVGLFLVADVCGVALSWHSVDINSQSSWIDGAVRHDPFHRTGCCRAFGRLKQGHPQPTDQHHERVDQNHVVKLHLLREPTDSILCMRSGGIT